MEKLNTYRKLTDFEKFDSNPFIDNKQIKKDLKKRKSTILLNGEINPNDTEQENSGSFNLIYGKTTYDFDSYIKTYPAFYKGLRCLNKPATEILSIFYKLILYEKTEILLIEEELMKELGWKTKKNYYKGIASLLNNNFIACSNSQHKFFLNPYMMFKGKLGVLLPRQFQ